MNFLYTLIIFPLVQIIELCYLFVYRVADNPGIALFGVSIVVSALTLPLYFRAEAWQKAERELQKRLAPKIARIKAAFAGDEQYMDSQRTTGRIIIIRFTPCGIPSACLFKYPFLSPPIPIFPIWRYYRVFLFFLSAIWALPTPSFP